MNHEVVMGRVDRPLERGGTQKREWNPKKILDEFLRNKKRECLYKIRKWGALKLDGLR